MLLGALAALASFALVHLVTVFPLSWIQLRDPRSVDELLWVQAGGSVLAALGMVASGWLADRIGRRRLLAAAALAIGAFGLVAPWLLGGSHSSQNLYLLIGFALDHGTFGGGSDGNFTGALGIPTLDGLGCVGAGPHTLGEHVLVSELVPRASLFAGLLSSLAPGETP